MMDLQSAAGEHDASSDAAPTRPTPHAPLLILSGSVSGRSNTKKQLNSKQAGLEKPENGAGDDEGVRVGDVAVRGARAAVPGGGRRRVRARGHEPRGRRPPPPGLPRQEPLRPGARARGRRPHPLRVARDREARAAEAQAGAAGGGRLAGGGGDGGRVDGGGGAAAPRPDGRHHGAVHRRPAPRRRARPGRRRRERRQAEEGAGGVRGAAVHVEVPRRGVPHARRPQSLPHDALLHGDRVQGAGGGTPACEGVVGGAQVPARGEEGHGDRRSCRRSLGSEKGRAVVN